jgi:flagellar biosynthesis/type III secretory pathway protein FliH
MRRGGNRAAKRDSSRQQGRQEGIQEGRQEGRQEGLQEGRAEISKQVREWDERRKAAEARGESFDEPLPIDAEGSSD